jgi:hypothetical protein
MDRISEAAKKLNALVDKANEAIKTTEHRLHNDGAGIDVSIMIETKQQELKFSYGRWHSKFRILVADNDNCKPWSECDRFTKLETFKYLPQLLAKIAEELEARYDFYSEKS